MGKIKQSTIYTLLFFILLLVTLSINKLLGIAIALIAICILISKNLYLRKIIKANKLYAAKNYKEALNLYRNNINKKNIPGFILNNYLIMELKYGDSTIAEKFANNIDLNNSKIKPADLLSIKISKALIAWKNNRATEAISSLEKLLEETETTYLYETLTSLLIVNNNLDNALTVLNKGLEYNDSSNVLKSNYAETQYLLGNFKESENIFRELIDSKITFVEPYYYLALILLHKEDKDAALEFLNKALSFNDSLVSLVNKEKVNELIESI